MAQLIIVRHGESTWNNENRFTGWVDVDLSPKGTEEAIAAGQALKALRPKVDVVYTSYLKRAIKTCNIILEQMDLLWMTQIKNWRLNERHYGGLQGLNKTEMAEKHGEAQVKIWRRSFDTPPPLVTEADPQHPRNDPRYQSFAAKDLPAGESLKDTIARFMPLWSGEIKDLLEKGKNVLIVAHGNSLRALIKELEGLSAEEIMEVNLPTGVPIIYELDSKLKVISKKFVGDEATVKAAMDKVANQGKAK
ncbi:MAG: 2,3-diphosphoglycerate-dependent phosphoglycerate mutase [Bdellovibrionota bacterium]